MLVAPVLFVVRWNTLNGKAAALGMFIAAGNTAMLVLRKDDFAFVLRGWYLFVAMFVLAGVHLACNANPMLTSAMLLAKEKEFLEKRILKDKELIEKEKARAERAAGKAKGGKTK